MNRNLELDIIKGISIIAVVFYHLGVCKFGYLGVDIFFCVGGYLFCKNLNQRKEIDVLQYIYKKIKRLYPLVLTVCFISLMLGYFLMLPDDYENLGEAVVASTLFSENILEAITTKNYWNIANAYKPLMHLWYVSVLFQLYLFVSILYIISIKTGNINRFKNLLISLTLVSLILNIMPFEAAAKFYYLPFRLFEFTLGGLMAYYTLETLELSYRRYIVLSVITILVCLLILPEDFLNKNTRYYIIPFLVPVVIACINSKDNSSFFYRNAMLLKFLSFVGRMSYSIYIWHQFLIAFLLYSVLTHFSLLSIVIFLILLSFISIISFLFFEKGSSILFSNKLLTKFSVVLMLISNITFGFFIYFNAGFTRDVPELDIYEANVHRGMHAEYVDKPYLWNKDFTDSRKKNILVFGNSFGRDFANILNESSLADRIEIFYYPNDKVTENKISYIKQLADEADYVFCALGPGTGDLNPILINTIAKEKLYIVGDKKFGYSNGIIYTRRFKNDYFSSIAEVDYELIQSNAFMKEKYGNHFIDMYDVVLHGKNHVRVFTDNNKFISQDTTHLTKAGAVYYAKMLDLKKYININ